MDEFDSIARLFRPLATALEALGLMDDAAVLSSRPGFDLVVTADAIVEGVHFLPTDPPDLVARKLLRVNLSDLAAKAAEPYGYILTVAWSPEWGEDRRKAFARGLGEDQAAFGLKLFGGDTVATPGPMTASVTMFGWVPAGRMVKRSGAQAGDVLLVSGTIGDGGLGLKAARGEVSGEGAAWLADRYYLPQPRLALRQALLTHATAAADVSDGLLADARHIGEASGVGIEIALDRVPVSEAGQSLLSAHPRGSGDPVFSQGASGSNLGPRFRGDERKLEGLLQLATCGDDYEIVCACVPEKSAAFQAAALEVGIPLTVIGRVIEGQGVFATFDGQSVPLDRLGWRHG